MLVYENKKMNNTEFKLDSHPDIESGWYARILSEGDIPSVRRLGGPEEDLIDIPVFYELNKSYRIQKEELVWYDQWKGEWDDLGRVYSHIASPDWEEVERIEGWRRIEEVARERGVRVWNDTRLKSGWVATVPLINEQGSRFGYSVRDLEGPEDDLYIVEVEGIELQEKLSLISPLAWEVNLVKGAWHDGWVERRDLWDQIRGHGKECRIE